MNAQGHEGSLQNSSVTIWQMSQIAFWNPVLISVVWIA